MHYWKIFKIVIPKDPSAIPQSIRDFNNEQYYEANSRTKNVSIRDHESDID